MSPVVSEYLCIVFRILAGVYMRQDETSAIDAAVYQPAHGTAHTLRGLGPFVS